MIEKFFTCACFGEGLRVSYDAEDKSWYVTLWRQGYRESTDWTHRLRHIWRILRTGQPWHDQVLLNDDEAKALGKFLTELKG
jgi:hypothetical protein